MLQAHLLKPVSAEMISRFAQLGQKSILQVKVVSRKSSARDHQTLRAALSVDPFFPGKAGLPFNSLTLLLAEPLSRLMSTSSTWEK